MNILVVGVGEYQVCGIEKLKQKGHYVIGVDGNPYAIGRKIVDVFFCEDITSPSKILDLIRRENLKLDSAMCFSVEIALRTVAFVNDTLNLRGLSMNEVLVATDKAMQRKIQKEAGLPVPMYIELHSDYDRNISEEISYPVVVKPTDSAGSRGVSIVWNSQDLLGSLANAFSQSKFDSKVIVEEFIPGLEFTVEALIVNNKVTILGISEKRKPINNHTVSIELFYNSPFVQEKREKIKKVVIPFLKKCGFNNTITHTEVMYSYRDHQFYIVETTVRSGGFHIFDKILPGITGIDIISYTIDTMLGENPVLPKVQSRSGILGFFYSNFGIIKNIEIVKSAISNLDVEYELFVSPGAMIRELSTDGARLGYYITFDDNWQLALCKARQLEYAIKFEIE